jgi:hypothetical protein
MDQHSPRHEDNLSDVERHLAGWHPASGGLDADAMLFAAGRAAGRRGPGRLLWPALCLVLAVQAAGLTAWGLSERAECRSLAERLRERAPAPSAPPATAVAEVPEPSYTPSPDDYFHLRRRAEQDWLASLPSAGLPTHEPPAEPPIPRAGQRDRLLDQ